jgi:hypothetical protein
MFSVGKINDGCVYYKKRLANTITKEQERTILGGQNGFNVVVAATEGAFLGTCSLLPGPLSLYTPAGVSVFSRAGAIN